MESTEKQVFVFLDVDMFQQNLNLEPKFHCKCVPMFLISFLINIVKFTFQLRLIVKLLLQKIIRNMLRS